MFVTTTLCWSGMRYCNGIAPVLKLPTMKLSLSILPWRCINMNDFKKRLTNYTIDPKDASDWSFCLWYHRRIQFEHVYNTKGASAKPWYLRVSTCWNETFCHEISISQHNNVSDCRLSLTLTDHQAPRRHHTHSKQILTWKIELKQSIGITQAKDLLSHSSPSLFRTP